MRIYNKRMDLHSLRCVLLLPLQAILHVSVVVDRCGFTTSCGNQRYGFKFGKNSKFDLLSFTGRRQSTQQFGSFSPVSTLEQTYN